MNDEQKAQIAELLSTLAKEGVEPTAEIVSERAGFEVSDEQLAEVVDAMEADKQEAVFGAMAELVKKEPSKKPNVKLIEGIAKIDINADERDAYWADFQETDAFKAAIEGDGGGTDDADADDDDDSQKVTNNYTGALLVCGTRIPAGETMPVPKFDAEHSVMKIWLDREIISVE